MDLMQAIRERHSVRNFQDVPISADDVAELDAFIAEQNAESGLHMQLIRNEPKAFNSPLIKLVTHYGKFRNVKNYIALIGRMGDEGDGPGLEEKCGYFGERVVLHAQQMGLRTCWVAGTYKKVPSACDIAPGERIVAVIAIGYGNDDGRQHKSKSLQDVMRVTGGAVVAGAGADAAPDPCDSGTTPDWFVAGVEAALLAPTAINQQKFLFEWDGTTVTVSAQHGPYCMIDLGIVKCHFEIGSGHAIWK